MGPRAVLDAVVKRKIPSHRRESNPRTPIVQLGRDISLLRLGIITAMKIQVIFWVMTL
jgi:hypothetical protein